MDYGIFNVRRDINACDGTQRCADTVKESAVKVDDERKSLARRRGIEPTSEACRSDALPTELHPHPAGHPVLRTQSHLRFSLLSLLKLNIFFFFF